MNLGELHAYRACAGKDFTGCVRLHSVLDDVRGFLRPNSYTPLPSKVYSSEVDMELKSKKQISNKMQIWFRIPFPPPIGRKNINKLNTSKYVTVKNLAHTLKRP